MKQRPTTRITAPGKPGAALIAELQQLRDSHRLGVHMWGDGNGGTYLPDGSRKWFDIPAHEIQPRLTAGTMPLRSVSLFPSKKTGLSLIPYSGYLLSNASLGYMIDLRTEQPHPPQVLYATESTLTSGSDPLDKRWKFTDWPQSPRLAAIYQRFGTKEAWLKEFTMGNGVRLTAEQLDAFGKDIEEEPHYYEDKSHSRFTGSACTDFNELLVATSRDHIRALTISAYDLYPNKPHFNWFDAAIRLSGALAGLEHLSKGYDLPVVIQHISAPNAGNFTYLGQGQEALTKVARDALIELFGDEQKLAGLKEYTRNHSYQMQPFEHIVQQTRELLGIDLDQPRPLLLQSLAAENQKARPR